MFVELLYGYLSNSLSLISDSVHMLFDSLGLLISLAASYTSKIDSKDRYAFGYIKVETLAGLCNAIFLLFVSITLFNESLHRIYNQDKVDVSKYDN